MQNSNINSNQETKQQDPINDIESNQPSTDRANSLLYASLNLAGMVVNGAALHVLRAAERIAAISMYNIYNATSTSSPDNNAYDINQPLLDDEDSKKSRSLCCCRRRS
jgi:hypothetical protein